MRKLNVILLFVVLLFAESVFGQSGWQKINFDNRYKLTKVIFFNENTGLVAGNCDEVLFPYRVNADLFRTTNGGLNWNIVGGSDFGIISDLNFFNSTNGFFSTNGPWLNIIMYTSNGGLNWHGSIRDNNESNDATLYSSAIINNTTAYGGSDNGEIYKTTNSGVNWDLFTTTPLNSNVNKISFFNDLKGYAFDEFLESCKTNDGGQSWLPYIGIYNVQKISFLSQDTMIGLTTQTYEISSNGGASWQQYAIDLGDFSAKDMYYFNRMKILAAGGASGNKGIINVTTNGGANWQRTELLNSKTLNSVCFVNNLVGYAVGDSGCIFKTISGGVTNISSNQTTAENYSLSQNYPNPFNPSTRINYELKITNYVSLKVFDLLGKEVAALVNEKQNAGSYAVDFNSAEYNLPSGIYLYTLNAGKFKETRKMILVK